MNKNEFLTKEEEAAQPLLVPVTCALVVRMLEKDFKRLLLYIQNEIPDARIIHKETSLGYLYIKREDQK
jgi:hypothetical protein